MSSEQPADSKGSGRLGGDVRIERKGERLQAETADGAARLRGQVYPSGLFGCGKREGEVEGLATIARVLHKDGLKVISTERESDRDWNEALLLAGYELYFTKILVRRDLETLEPFDCPFEWRTLAEIGDAAMSDWLTQVAEGEPVVEGEPRDPDREWREQIEYAGDKLDRNLWRVALLEGEVVGVVLPQTFGGDPPEGTLFHVGLLPRYRGKGLGRLLHRAGLHLLAEAGDKRYVGSTDIRNEPMARVFAANDCDVSVKQVYFRPVK